MFYLVFDDVEAVATEAVAICGVDVFFLLLGEGEAKTLALSHVARLALKGIFAAGAIFGFVAGHDGIDKQTY